MISINENELYKIYEFCDELPMLDNKYFPKVEDIKNNVSEENLDKTLIFLIYFANDPYSENEEFTNNSEYQKMVKFANNYISKHVKIIKED